MRILRNGKSLKAFVIVIKFKIHFLLILESTDTQYKFGVPKRFHLVRISKLSILAVKTMNGLNWFRPGGNSSITETSRSPYKLNANVRGWRRHHQNVEELFPSLEVRGGGFLPIDRCSTPKRCCSSLPVLFLNFTHLLMKRRTKTHKTIDNFLVTVNT
jgi:hypothetical protein